MKKSWNFPLYRAIALHDFMEQLIGDFECGALVQADGGRALHVRARTAADLATLPHAAHLCLQYLQLKDGEIAILNDPYAGGSKLSDITLVMGIALGAAKTEVLLAQRLAFQPASGISGKLDDEGVRIPPTPLGTSSKLNREILQAIASHPLAPRGVENAVVAAVNELEQRRQVLKAVAKDPHSDFQVDAFKNYLNSCRETLQALIARLPLGETQVTEILPGGELLKLRLEIHDEKAVFDFNGTETSTHLQLTDRAVFGACFQVIRIATGHSFPANAGSFHQIEVRTPAKSMVNAKAPAGTARGMSEGIAVIGRLAMKAFGQLHGSFRRGEPSCGMAALELRFQSGKSFSEYIAGGTAAQSEAPGLDGCDLWNVQAQATSIEDLESSLPLLVKTIAPFVHSGGRGKWAGGNGINKTYVLLESAELSATIEKPFAKPEGLEGGKAAQSGDVQVIQADGVKRQLEKSGHLRVQAGESIRILSAGGSGFGLFDPEKNPTK